MDIEIFYVRVLGQFRYEALDAIDLDQGKCQISAELGDYLTCLVRKRTELGIAHIVSRAHLVTSPELDRNRAYFDNWPMR